MAWPLSRYRDHVANTTVIGADLLNALQDQDIAIASGTGSVKALVVDGTGGASVTGTAGTAKVSASASGTTAPTTTVPAGTVYKESVCMGYAVGTVAAGVLTVVRLFNVYSTPTRNAAGDFTVVFDWVPSDIAGVVISGSCLKVGGGYGFINPTSITAGAGGRLTVQFYTVGFSGGGLTPIDVDGWCIEVKGL